MSKQLEELKSLALETAGSVMTISPKEKGWECIMMMQKKTFINDDIEKLAEEVSSFIKENRASKEVIPDSKKPGAKKPFQLKR
jgi:hypothetical protein